MFGKWASWEELVVRIFGTNVLVKGLLIKAIIEWIIGIRGIMLT
jgi:hypothetical protein